MINSIIRVDYWISASIINNYTKTTLNIYTNKATEHVWGVKQWDGSPYIYKYIYSAEYIYRYIYSAEYIYMYIYYAEYIYMYIYSAEYISKLIIV